MRHTRKTILITGASAGLGEEMARQFAAKGRNLALCARRTERLSELKNELTAKHPEIKVSIKSLDVADYESVFTIFREFASEFGILDRIIVNAGIGKGQPIGIGQFSNNRQIAETNFVGALAQCEAAVEIFRKQQDGHLVVVSSVAAYRGLGRGATTYGATKAAVHMLAEGIRADSFGTPVRVTTLFPGFIATEIVSTKSSTPFIVDVVTGTRSMVGAIEREVAVSSIPRWPWAPIGFLMRHLPLRLAAKMG